MFLIENEIYLNELLNTSIVFKNLIRLSMKDFKDKDVYYE